MENKQIIEAFNLITDITMITNTLDSTTFESVVCMVLEEWCKENDQDIITVINEIHDLILLINKTDGKY